MNRLRTAKRTMLRCPDCSNTQEFDFDTTDVDSMGNRVIVCSKCGLELVLVSVLTPTPTMESKENG